MLIFFTSLIYFSINYGEQSCCFQFKEIIDDLVLALSDSFEYLYYGYTAIITILLFQCGDDPHTQSAVLKTHINYFICNLTLSVTARNLRTTEPL